jgi:hypothetical protein
MKVTMSPGGDGAMLHDGAFRPIARLARPSTGRAQGFPQRLWKNRRRLGRRVAAAAVLVGFASSSVAQDVPVATPSPTATPAPTPVSRVTRQLLNHRLNLPSYARYGGDPFDGDVGVPAFTETVEVTAHPMDTASLTAKMKWWMEDFEPVYAGAGPARFHAPTLAEMREHRPSPPQSADITPLLGWLLGKLGKGGDDKKK